MESFVKPQFRYGKVLLGIAVFGAALSVAWHFDAVGDQRRVGTATVTPRRDPAQQDSAASASPDLAWLRLPQRAPISPPNDGNNPFAPHSWAPPPPAPQPPPPPPPPTPVVAPPLPFVFLGSLIEDDGPTLFYLARDDRAYAVMQDEVIDNAYRVNGLKGTRLSITYLPLDQEQMLVMPIGSETTVADGAPKRTDTMKAADLVPAIGQDPLPQPSHMLECQDAGRAETQTCQKLKDPSERTACLHTSRDNYVQCMKGLPAGSG